MRIEEEKTTIMNLAVKAYELFKDDEIKAKGLADIFDTIEHYYMPRFEAIRKADLENTKIQLTLEIEKVRSDINNMQVEVNKIKSETANHRSETEKLRSETEKLRSETEKIRHEGRIERDVIKSDIEKFRYENRIELTKILSENEKMREEFKKDIAVTYQEIEKSKTDILKFMNRHTLLVISSVSVIVALLKGLDYLLK